VVFDLDQPIAHGDVSGDATRLGGKAAFLFVRQFDPDQRP
jgi:hypothetical protein